MRQFFQDLDEALSVGPWILGDHYSLADVAVVPYVTRIADLNILSMAAACGNALSWFERCKERPSYADAVTRWEDAALLTLMRRGGEQYGPKVREILSR